ncbi:helix-turn-helix transcriptional regulator [Sphingosinicella sp. LHD-64]|uniref:ArsR/SmtB family transcription factor n=1 Tax=Sphingosinicella sp. LHD-64 TaxID=3072139 RepID=UPI00280D8D99|nr:helix-turn-helix transcriptional regulator [Sphingosinicella sp. LHD-64]MDQ8756632.1 helix-turn-helix transcriptional regulator [Sphingosinicella sp. LHD-64]
MDEEIEADGMVARIAAAIGEPARARMLFCLMDGCARTSTELAVVADVGASTASAHLGRLAETRLVKVSAQGKHRYYSLVGADVAKVLEGLSVLATGTAGPRVSRVPNRLRIARTCYDHMAGSAGVALHDRFVEQAWLDVGTGDGTYDLTAAGEEAFAAIGIDTGATRAQRRRFACACLDWSERRPHLAGALGAAFLKVALARKWMIQDLDSRALSVTARGRQEFLSRFAVQV